MIFIVFEYKMMIGIDENFMIMRKYTLLVDAAHEISNR